MANLSSHVSQPNLLLTTKLYIPPSRSRLTERLNKGLTRALTPMKCIAASVAARRTFALALGRRAYDLDYQPRSGHPAVDRA